LVIQIFRVDGSGVVEQPQLILSEPTGKQAKSAETTVQMDTSNLIHPSLIGVLERNHNANGAIW
jgi:hypothetical protein